MDALRRRLVPLALGVGTTLLIAGCSSPVSEPTPTIADVIEETVDPPEEEVDEEPRVYPSGAEYFFVATEGAVGKFTFPGEPYAPAEELRAIIGAPPVTYVTVTVDNREGSVGVNMYELAAFDADGRKYTFSTVDTVMDDWMQSVGTETNEDIELYNRFVDAINANMVYADVGQVVAFVMASPDVDLPTEFRRIAVQPSGMGTDVEVLPVSEANGVDLSFEAPQ